MTPPTILPYPEAADLLRGLPFRAAEVPVEHAVSLPLPTGRAGAPGYAQFAAPAVRRPGAPTVQSAPDRWWVLGAESRSVLVYARVSAVPFGAPAFDRQEVPSPAPDLAAAQRAQAEFTAAVAAVTGPFFAAAPAPAAARAAVPATLARAVPAALVPVYRALAPDFFTWLEDAS